MSPRQTPPRPIGAGALRVIARAAISRGMRGDSCADYIARIIARSYVASPEAIRAAVARVEREEREGVRV